MRSLSKSLSKEWLQQFNFIENLTAEAARINTSKKVDIQFTHPIKLPLEADRQIILFRIVQEALQNALKHAKATNISILVTQKSNALIIAIEDDGKDFAINSTKDGMGIMNIKHRTNLLGGRVGWASNNNVTTISINLPIENEE